MSQTIPLVDLSKCGLEIAENEKVNDQDLYDVGIQLYAALSTSGFAYLSNHGIPRSKIEGLHSLADAFYSSPEEEKRKLYEHSMHFAYDPIGSTKVDKKHIDYQEGFRITGEAYSDETIQWPEVPGFKETCFEFASTAAILLMRLLKALGYGMKLKDKDYFCNVHSLINKKGNLSMLKMIKYPPVSTDDVLAEHKLRLGEHCDWTTMILLFQDGIGGLQVEDKSGEFIDVTPIPGTIIMNVGETLQAWSGKRLKATKHRVCPPRDPEKRSLIRRSIVYFGQANDDELLKKLEFEEAEDDTEESVAPLTVAQFMAKRFDETFF